MEEVPSIHIPAGTFVTVYVDGRVNVSAGTGPVQSANGAEDILKEHFGAKEMTLSEYRAVASSSNPVRVRFGTQSAEVLRRVQKPGFHSGRRSSH